MINLYGKVPLQDLGDAQHIKSAPPGRGDEEGTKLDSSRPCLWDNLSATKKADLLRYQRLVSK